MPSRNFVRQTKPQTRMERVTEEQNAQRGAEQNDQRTEPPLTRTGHPDRRFKGFRDLPPPEDQNPDYRKANTGPVLPDGTHLTIDGRPDRRFKENRGKTDEEVLLEWAQTVQQQFGSRVKQK